jgi:hypothetical protein
MGLGFKSEIAMKDHDYVQATWEIEIKPVWMPANEVSSQHFQNNTFLSPLLTSALPSALPSAR